MKTSYAFAAILFILVLVAGCGGGSQTATPPPPVLAIALSTAPPATLAASGTVSIAATVTNDSANGGVDWSCAPAGACGTFNPAHTASGAATTYTAPSAAGSVTIVAAATSKSSTTATATVTITATTPAITVTLSTAPPTSLAVNATASVAATVANDTANAGVDWSCTPVGTCGSFSPTHTASGATTTFTAPAAAVSATITAASTTTPAITASAPVNIVAGTATLSGNFTFFASGMEANSRLFSLAGVATLTTAGTVTGGEQDFNDGSSTNKSPTGGDQITGGSYTLGADGRGTLTLITNNANLGKAGTETFSIAMVNSSHLLIESFDSTATSSGSMDLQSPVLTDMGALSGAYSFAVLGKFSTTTEGFGGIITITGSGTLHDAIDINEGGTVTAGSSNGTYTAQDSLGRGTLSFGGNTFVYYAVLADSTRTKAFRIIVTNSNETDIGSAFAQASGATFSPATIKGNYVFLEGGNHGNTGGFVTAGQFSADGGGNVTSGAADESEGGTPNDQTSGAVTGTYTLPTNGVGSLTITWATDSHKRGMYPTDPSINLLDPNNATGSGGAVLLSTDAHVGDGVLVQQGTTGTPSGNFGVGFHALNNSGEVDGVGQIVITTGSLTGTVDVNDLFHSNQAAGATFSGTLTADTANPGRFTLPLTLTIGGTPAVETIVVYQISSSQLVFVQTDTTQFATGVVELQQ